MRGIAIVMIRRCGLFMGLWLAVVVPTASGEVVATAPGGFTIKHVVTVARPASEVYAALVRPSTWWASSHTWSGKAANLSLDPKPGGCWCETLPNGAVQHMTVVYADAGKLLRLNGVLGPLQEMPLTGVMNWQFAEANGTTTVTLTYSVGGFVPSGVEAIAAPVNGVLGEQVSRLKRLVETGKPDATNPG